MGKSRLEGKVALITGGARGMGASEAQLFIDEGAKVVITDILDEVGNETAKRLSPDGSQCIFVHHDVTSESDWKAVLEQSLKAFGQIDILVNNAGIFERGSILDTELSSFERTMDINVNNINRQRHCFRVCFYSLFPCSRNLCVLFPRYCPAWG